MHPDRGVRAEHRDVLTQIRSLAQLDDRGLSRDDRCNVRGLQQPAGKTLLTHARAAREQQLEQAATPEQVEIRVEATNVGPQTQ